jgi:predicted Zn-dependent protease with MMP-like domain
VDHEQFRALVAEALDGLPEEFAARLENVEVVVEDEPSPTQLREMGLDPRRDTLFGLYQGVPLHERGSHYTALPDKITIFHGPIVRAYRRPDRIRREIARTVVHEVGHFFGMDDSELHRLGY